MLRLSPEKSGGRPAAGAIPSRNRPSDTIENQLMIVGFAQWPFLAEVGRLLGGGIDIAREDGRDAGSVCAHPGCKRKGVLRTGRIDIGQDHVDHQRAAALRQKPARFIEIGGLDNPVAAFPQIFSERVSNENVGIDKQDAGQP
jgi:hypothetical protein